VNALARLPIRHPRRGDVRDRGRRLERPILGLGDIARVHVYRWGDGSAPSHVWFLPHPLGMLEARREMLPLWADLMPEAPKEAVADA
jgi:hypothetical protein